MSQEENKKSTLLLYKKTNNKSTSEEIEGISFINLPEKETDKGACPNLCGGLQCGLHGTCAARKLWGQDEISSKLKP